ncbi:MAG: PAS domain S-box protein, partial [Betaproteobacteria bacterium]|nr:PAS domain S-box protein [Betaproteobacteria bacterium]
MPLRRLTLIDRPAPARYSIATGVFLAALFLRFIALPVEARAGFLTFYPAMVLVLYLCGTGPGLWVLLLSAVTGFYFFYPPYSSWQVTPTSAFVTLSYVVSSLVIALVMRTLQNTNSRLADALARVELSDARWKAMVNDQTDVVARFDAQGAVLLANDVAQTLFGPAARPGARHSWRDAVHPDDLPRVLEQLATFTPKTPRVRFDCRVLDVEGSLHWVDFVDHALYDASGRLLEIQSVGRDVTDRKQLEENLRATEAELRDLYDNAPCGYYSLDAKGKFLRVNRGMEA